MLDGRRMSSPCAMAPTRRAAREAGRVRVGGRRPRALAADLAGLSVDQWARSAASARFSARTVSQTAAEEVRMPPPFSVGPGGQRNPRTTITRVDNIMTVVAYVNGSSTLVRLVQRRLRGRPRSRPGRRTMDVDRRARTSAGAQALFGHPARRARHRACRPHPATARSRGQRHRATTPSAWARTHRRLRTHPVGLRTGDRQHGVVAVGSWHHRACRSGRT